jgi:hypothetical protein
MLAAVSISDKREEARDKGQGAESKEGAIKAMMPA